jgi:hypothetical protein
LNQIFLIILLLPFLVVPAFGQESNPTGLKQNFSIETGGYDFTIDLIASFDVNDIEFSSDDKRLTFYFNSDIKNNLAEIQIPTNLINGNFTFFLNDQEIFPTVKTNEKISFITLEFGGNGSHKLDIIGTTYLPEFAEFAPMILIISLIGIIFVLKINKAKFYSLIRD